MSDKKDKKPAPKKAKATAKPKATPKATPKAEAKPKAAPKADKPTDLVSLKAKFKKEAQALRHDRAKSQELKAQYIKDIAALFGGKAYENIITLPHPNLFGPFHGTQPSPSAVLIRTLVV